MFKHPPLSYSYIVKHVGKVPRTCQEHFWIFYVFLNFMKNWNFFQDNVAWKYRKFPQAYNYKREFVSEVTWYLLGKQMTTVFQACFEKNQMQRTRYLLHSFYFVFAWQRFVVRFFDPEATLASFLTCKFFKREFVTKVTRIYRVVKMPIVYRECIGKNQMQHTRYLLHSFCSVFAWPRVVVRFFDPEVTFASFLKESLLLR